MKVDITHLAMGIEFQTSDCVVGMEKVTEWFSRKYSLCNSFQVFMILLIMEGTEKSESSY